MTPLDALGWVAVFSFLALVVCCVAFLVVILRTLWKEN